MCLRAKIRIFKVLRFKDHTNISWALSAWIDLVKSADLPEMNSLVKSFTYWYEEIRSALIYPYSNGFTEGCNNKIKVLKRVSFGLRNFERFRNRILYINTRTKRTRTVFSACPPGVHRHFSTPKFDKEPLFISLNIKRTCKNEMSAFLQVLLFICYTLASSLVKNPRAMIIALKIQKYMPSCRLNRV